MNERHALFSKYSIQDHNLLSNYNIDEELVRDVHQIDGYRQFSTFWTLNNYEADFQPIFSSTPVLCYQNLIQQEIPYFNTITTQRAMVPSFRMELVFRSIRNSDKVQRYYDTLANLNFMCNFSNESKNFLDIFNNYKNINSLSRSHLSRLLAAIGFFDEALFVLQQMSLDNEIHAYECLTYLFILGIVDNSKRGQNTVLELSKNFIDNVLDNEKTLRMRLTCAMNACVIASRSGQKNDAKSWREYAEIILQKIQLSNAFNELEINLLTSRFYRAVSYVPFLTSDYDLLREDAKLCEEYAKKVTPSTEYEMLLYKENIYPMSESLSRIYQELNEHDLALEYMKNIEDIEYFDTKFFIQIGDLYAIRQNFTMAEKYYLKACELSLPMGAIAWFKLGQIYEIVIDYDSALAAYLESVNLNIYGLSPLENIYKLAKTIKHRELINWSYLRIEKLKNMFNVN